MISAGSSSRIDPTVPGLGCWVIGLLGYRVIGLSGRISQQPKPAATGLDRVAGRTAIRHRAVLVTKDSRIRPSHVTTTPW